MKRLACFLVLGLPFAAAQVGLSGEVELGPNVAVGSQGSVLEATPGLTLRLHLDIEALLEPLTFRARLDPALLLNGPSVESAFLEPGLTEAYALWRGGVLDLSLGLERLPLETARLSVPFGLEPLGKTGQPLGLLGIRASLYLDDWRVRPVLVYRIQDGQLGGVLSARGSFAGFDLEAHASYLEQRFAVGLGGSGLVGETVLYGEAWLLSNPLEPRGAVGASGYLGDALLTAELAYAPSSLLPGGLALPQALAQATLPRGDGSWNVGAGLALTESLLSPGERRLAAFASVGYTHPLGDEQLAAKLSLAHTEAATVYTLALSLTSFF